MATIQVHIPPIQFARHVNDEPALQAFFRDGGAGGLQSDVHLGAEWTMGEGRMEGGGMPFAGFLSRLLQHTSQEGAGRRIRTILDVHAARVDEVAAERFVQDLRRFAPGLHPVVVSYAPEVVRALHAARVAHDVPMQVQLYLQEDDLKGHAQWQKRDALELPVGIGYHLRLHAFTPGTRPTYDEAVAAGRHITTTGWNPLYPGWRNIDLSEVWNLKRR